jgi:diguanylate cyclase (GGDEF)-like protein/PAS domain S-box-containing protein
MPSPTMPPSRYIPADNLVDMLLDAICVVDKEGHFLFVSAACERIFGYSPQEMLDRPMIELVHPDDRSRTLDAVQEIMAGAAKPVFENRYVHKDGRTVHILWSARWSDDQQVRIAVAHDITERKRSESLQDALYRLAEAAHKAEDEQQLFQQLQHTLAEQLPASRFNLAVLGPDGEQLAILGSAQDEAHGQLVHQLSLQVLSSAQPLLLSAAEAAHMGQQNWLLVPCHAQAGCCGVLSLSSDSAEPGYSHREQELLQFVATQVSTAIERQRMLSRLQHMAQYDQLTQLPNRSLLHDRLQQAMARARREQRQLALLFLDLDKFKLINDSLGHAMGDLLLQQVAERIRQCLREVDTVARFAGDEFVVLLEDFHSDDHAIQVADKIRQALNYPFDLKGYQHPVRPSIGIALYPTHASDPQQLLHQADSAMYMAKHSGGNRYHLAD